MNDIYGNVFQVAPAEAREPELTLARAQGLSGQFIFDVQTHFVRDDFTSNVILQDNDTLIIPAADKFFVSGFVKTPGSYPLQLNMTVGQAIAQAGGLTERGSNRGITISRKDKNGKEIKVENVKPQDPVKAGDMIIVRQRRI